MTANGIELRVLGPVQAWVADRRAEMGDRKQRLVLGMLALDVNRVVSVGRLEDALWAGSPPASARRIIQAHVSRLRAAMTGAGASADRGALVRYGSGYLLAADPASVDAHRFRSLVEDARLTDDDTGRVGMLSEALALWKGPALADAAADEVRERLCGGLEEARLMAVEDLLEAELRLGQHRRLIDELACLAAQHPYRPRITHATMLALHRCGRTAEALRMFEVLRVRLKEELGLDPPAELTGLHLAILRAERGLCPPAASPAGQLPAQLPADIPDFVGRTGELAALGRLALERAAGDGAAARTVLITGGAGVGKTALAVHWAHLMAEAFPGGQLYLDLRGYSETSPVTPLQALTALLRGLGLPAGQVPADQGQAAAMYRSQMAARRMVVVLDNARSPQQVRPLLPGRSASVTLVTSRAGLGGLVAREGAVRVGLDALSHREALDLLSGMIGADRVNRDETAASGLARVCAYLPLALRIAAARLLALPHVGLGDYLREIASEDGFASFQLDGDESAGVRAAFDLSYAALDPPARRVFRLLGTMRGGNLSLGAIAAMNDAPPGDVKRVLGLLADAHLVEHHRGARFGQHDLLRRYAQLRSKAEDAEADRRAAAQRLLAWYLAGADRAARLFSPFALRHVPPVPGGGTGPRPDGREDALAWLEVERPHMVAAVVWAAGQDDPVALRLATQIARRLHMFLFQRGHLSDDIQVNHAARLAAKRGHDEAAEAWACIGLAAASGLQGRPEQALTWLDRALGITRGLGDAYQLAACLNHLSDTWWRLGEYGRCEPLLREEMMLRITTSDRYGEAFCQLNLGEVYCWQGHYRKSRAHYEQGKVTFREVGDQYGEALALHGLGSVDEHEGHPAGAVRHFAAAAAMLRGLANRSALGYMLIDLGRAHRRQGQRVQALNCLYEGLRLCREQGMRRREAEYLRELSLALGTLVPQQADRYHQQSQAILGELSG